MDGTSLYTDLDGRYYTQAEVDTLLAARDAFIELTDTPSSYSGQGLKGVRVNSAADALEFYTTVTDTDEKVGVDSGATAGYLGVASNDGVLRVNSPLTYADGGDFITLGTDISVSDISDISTSYLKLDGSNANTNIDIGSFNLTTSGKFETTGAGQTGRFLTGLAGVTVLAFDGPNFDIRAGAGNSASQNVLRVDSSGNFNFQAGDLTTTSTITAEQITSTMNMNLSGLLTNTLFAEDTTGMYIDGTLDPYTETATNYIQRLTRDIIGSSSLSLTSYGISTVFDNARRFTGSVSPDVNMITYGDFKNITVSGSHSGNTISDFNENNYASYNQLIRSGTLSPSASSISFNNYGSYNKVVDEIIWNIAETAVIKDYGIYSEVVQSGAENSGSMQKTGYAGYFKATGTTDGTSVLYGIYIDSVSGADTNWGIFDNSGKDGVISGKLRVGSTSAPASVLHIYENTADTTNAGITVEQDGAGDATAHFLLTSGQEWTIGIDNSNDDAFTISSSNDLQNNRQFRFTADANLIINERGAGSTGGRISVFGKHPTNDIVDMYTASVYKSGASAEVEFGVGYLFQLENAGGGDPVDAGRFVFEWETATADSEDSKFSVQVMSGGSFITPFSISGLDTSIQLHEDAKWDNAKFPVIDKASGNGIKIDTVTPTFGWRDLLGDQFAKNTGASKPILAQYNGAVEAWQFGDGDEAFLTYHIPHDYVAGTDIHLHIHWSQTYDSVTGGTIDMRYTAIYAKGHNQVSGSVFGPATPITATFSSIDINDLNGGLNQYQHHLTEVVISAATGTLALFDRDDLEPDGVIELTFEMVTNSLTGVAVTDPFIHYVDIHYQSTNIATKDKVPDFYA